jgi:BNR repeat-like domain
MRRLVVLAVGALALLAATAPAEAAPFTLGPTTVASGASPFAPGCGGAGESFASSVLYENAEVETHVAVNPANPANVVAFWQQDRWNDGGAHGLLAGYSFDGGLTWARSAPRFSNCAGGTGDAGGYQRATDPWLSFSPNGRLHAISLSFDNSTARNAVLAAYSDTGGATWSAPRIVRFDNPRAIGNGFNDKETLTADPFDSSLVYATWQRIVSPSERVSQEGYNNATSYYSEAWFARSTNSGASWEPARPIFRERGVLTQTIGNQVDVLPDGTLINGFNLIHAATNRHGSRGYNVALVRSPDKGVTWSRETIVNRLLVDEVTDPDDGHDVRTGDIIPDWAVDRSTTSTRGNVYAVWMDRRFNDADHNDILLARSTDGGLTWDAPVVADRTPRGVDAFTAMVDVDAQGRVAVSYYDFRNDRPGDAVLSTDMWVTHSHDGGRTFTDESRLTPSSFDMRTAPDALGYFVGDYTGLDHVGSVFHPAWVAANTGNLANRTDVFHRTAQ